MIGAFFIGFIAGIIGYETYSFAKPMVYFYIDRFSRILFATLYDATMMVDAFINNNSQRRTLSRVQRINDKYSMVIVLDLDPQGNMTERVLVFETTFPVLLPSYLMVNPSTTNPLNQLRPPDHVGTPFPILGPNGYTHSFLNADLE